MGDYKIYVGTYNKYNSGSIAGKWFDLEDYADKDEFLADAEKYHKDDPDPELMFQDYQGIPNWAIGESWIAEDFWEYMETLDDEDMRKAFDAYADNQYPGGTIPDLSSALSDFEEAYNGEHDSMKDFAYDLVDDLGIDNISNIESYFDQDSFVRDLGYDGWYLADDDDVENNPDDYPDGVGVYDPSGEFVGYASINQMVDEWLDDKGVIGKDTFQRYFDYEKFARDLELGGDYSYVSGFVFRNI